MIPLMLALAAAAPPAATVEVPVLNRTIERGEPLSAGDFSVEQRTVAEARGALGGAVSDGMEAKRRLVAGSVVHDADLARAQAVRRGEPVTIAYRVGALSISTQGRALAGGGVGDQVRVVSLATNRTLDGIVEAAGTVRLAGQ